MNNDLERLRTLMDRTEIYDCLIRYCRGADRLDREVMLSAYHPDALDDHGAVILQASEFVDWALDYHQEHQHTTQHAITNVTYDIQGDEAHVESYYSFWAANKAKPDQLAHGRYIDRFERREGEWRIAARVCITDGILAVDQFPIDPVFQPALKSNGPSLRNRADASYERPLIAPRPRAI